MDHASPEAAILRRGYDREMSESLDRDAAATLSDGS